MKPLNLKETSLKEEMKERCLAKGQYIDENAKAKFKMLCHLEDFEVQYWKLQQENKQLKEKLDYDLQWAFKYEKQVDNWNKLKEIIKKKFVAQGGFTSYEWNDLLNELLDKMQEIEGGVSDDNN